MMKSTIRYAAVVIALAVLTAVAAAQAIPVGTAIPVRIGNRLSSATANTGQSWSGTVARDVHAGKMTIKGGTRVHGKVTYVNRSGRLHKPGMLSLRMTSIEMNGHSEAVTSTRVSREGKSHTKSNVTKVGGGAAAGALIGGLAGGGKGALIGAGAGTAAGTGVAAATGKSEVVIPSETVLSFTVTGGEVTMAKSSRRKR
jgi:hypothetical protein